MEPPFRIGNNILKKKNDIFQNIIKDTGKVE